MKLKKRKNSQPKKVPDTFFKLQQRKAAMSRLQSGLKSLGGTSRTGGITQGGSLDRTANKSFEELKRLIHGKLVDKLDLSRVSDLAGDTLRREIRLVVERLCDTENPLLNRMERERLIDEVLDET